MNVDRYCFFSIQASLFECDDVQSDWNLIVLLQCLNYVAQLDFVLRDAVPNAFIRVNPLGLQVTYFRVDQAFQ